VDVAIALPLLAVLVLAWGAARRAARRYRREREAMRQRAHSASRTMIRPFPDTITERSEMRATDAPVTVIDAFRGSADSQVGADPSNRPRRG